MHVFIFQVSTIVQMRSYRCFLKYHVLVIALSILLSSYYWSYLLVLVLLSPFIFSFLSQQKPSKSNLDTKSINEDANLSNALLFPKSQLHEDVHEYVEDISYSKSESNDVSFSSSSQDCSDGSISDEESLIELEIPSGIYVASPTQTKKGKQEEDEFITKMCDFHHFKDPMFDLFDTETRKIFKQQSILDLLAEINEMCMEEDNLIEIDIAMGSIKN